MKSIVLWDIYREDFDDIAYDLLNGLLELNPGKRISLEMALEHPFFEDVDVARFHNNW